MVRAGPRWHPRVVGLPNQSLFPAIWCKLHANMFPYGGIVTTLAVTAEVKQGRSLDHQELIEILRSLSDSAILNVDGISLSARELAGSFSDAVVSGIFGDRRSTVTRRGCANYAVTLITSLEGRHNIRPSYKDIAQVCELAPPKARLAKSILKSYQTNDYEHYQGDVCVARTSHLLAYLPLQDPSSPHRKHDKTMLALLTRPAELAVLQKVVATIATDELRLARRHLREAQHHTTRYLRNAFRRHFLSDLVANSVNDLMSFHGRLPTNPRKLYDVVARAAETPRVLEELSRESDELFRESTQWTPPVKAIAAPVIQAAGKIAVGAFGA